jgi:hypothetical protein
MDLQIEDLIRGIATGNYVRRVGSQFGSVWGWDGLMAAEATPEQYAAFGASPKVKLCQGRSISWLGQEWFPILAYSRGWLHHVSIHTEPNGPTFTQVCAWLETILGKEPQLELPQDISQPVLRRFVWNGRDGTVSVVCTLTYLQVGIGPYTWLRRVLACALRCLGVRGR